jgi:hypothetical protein
MKPHLPLWTPYRRHLEKPLGGALYRAKSNLDIPPALHEAVFTAKDSQNVTTIAVVS